MKYFLMIPILLGLFSCSSSERKPFMIVGERNLEDSLGIGLGAEVGYGKTEFKKSEGMTRQHRFFDTYAAGVGIGTGFRLNRFSMGISSYSNIESYSKFSNANEEQMAQELESFNGTRHRGIVSMSYMPTLNADWSAHSLSFRYALFDKFKFSDFSDNTSVKYESNGYLFQYTYGVGAFFLRTGVNFNIRDGGFTEKGHLLGLGISRDNLTIGFYSSLKNYEDELIIRANMIYFSYGINLFDIAI